MYNLRMIVYGELLFIENMIIGGVLLYLTGEICGRRNDCGEGSYASHQLHAYKWRLQAGSIMCGLFSLVIFLDAKVPLMMLMEVVFAACVCTVVFGCKGCGDGKKASPLRLPWRQAVVFILVTYFVGGITMGLLLVTRQPGIHTAVGIYTGDMKAAALTLFICVGYVTVKQIIKTVRNKKLFTEHTYEAEIVIGEHIIKANAFLDTGNRLKDPLTGKPVAVASEEFWEKMMWEEMQNCGELANFEHMDISKVLDIRFAVVPYEAVGTKGMLEAIRTDHIEVAGRKTVGCLIAQGQRDFKIGYDLLISGEMIE